MFSDHAQYRGEYERRRLDRNALPQISSAIGAAWLIFLPLASAQDQKAIAPAPSATAEPGSFINLLALMLGHCKTLSIAGHTFACKTIAYAHGDNGRVSFTVAVEDPRDQSHVVSFSGTNGKRADDSSYELPIDCMLLNSRDRPKVNGLPMPTEHMSKGICRQTGNFGAKRVSDITCSATDNAGRKYELLFVSDGTPVPRIRQSTKSIESPFR